MTNLAVLITCYNRKEKSLSCLRSLYICKIPANYKINVFLVDDGSTDGTRQAIEKEFPEANIINGNGNLYWNRGMHLAWVTAASHYDFDFYMWLNDDTILFEDAITELIYCSKVMNDRAIVCGTACSQIDSSFTYGGLNFNNKPIYPNGKVTEINILNGNCVLIPKYVYECIGVIDPIFPHSMGDHDYGLRFQNVLGKCVATRKYIATCEKNDRLPKWCYSSTPILDRVKSLYSPLGRTHPKYFFIYERRHFGTFTAIKHYFTVHLRALFPQLWN